MEKIYKFFEFLEKKENRDIPGRAKLIYDPNYKFDINDFEDKYGNINLTRIKKDFNLPNNLKVRGNLDLHGSSITSLPDNLEVNGPLDLSYTNIESLPDNLKVRGSLYLQDSSITSLPDNLEVGKGLYLWGCKIESLPDNLKVGRDLYLDGTSLATKLQGKSEEELKKMFPNVKGRILLR